LHRQSPLNVRCQTILSKLNHFAQVDQADQAAAVNHRFHVVLTQLPLPILPVKNQAEENDLEYVSQSTLESCGQVVVPLILLALHTPHNRPSFPHKEDPHAFVHSEYK